jgi:hypothetical protein
MFPPLQVQRKNFVVLEEKVVNRTVNILRNEIVWPYFCKKFLLFKEQLLKSVTHGLYIIARFWKIAQRVLIPIVVYQLLLDGSVTCYNTSSYSSVFQD